MSRTVASQWFFGESSRLDWPSIAKGQHVKTVGELAPMLVLRWALHPEVGLPAEPFIVWTRQAGDAKPTPVLLSGQALAVTPSSPRDVHLPERSVHVFLSVDTTTATLTLEGYDTGGNRICGFAVQPGLTGQSVVLTGTGIARVHASGTGRVNSAGFVAAAPYANLPDWRPLEVVGLPVDEGAGLPYDTGKQGPLSGPVAPVEAAVDRLTRGAPRLGWPASGGFSGPEWIAPDFPAFVEENRQTLLPQLMTMLLEAGDPSQQVDFRVVQPLPPPQNASGGSSPTAALGDAHAEVPPLGLLQIAAHGDMYAALALGFATAFPSPQAPVTHVAPPVDYMVTVKHRFQVKLGSFSYTFDGELAAFFVPTSATRPAAPGALAAQLAPGGMRPGGRDLPRLSTMNLSWNRPENRAGSMQAVSSVVARALPAEQPSLMVPTRKPGAPIPFVSAVPDNATLSEALRVTFVDGVFPDPSAPAGGYTYCAIGQNRWGLWSSWSQALMTVPDELPQLPLVVGVQLRRTDLDSTAPPQSATLSIDVSWDWHDRSPASIEVAAIVDDGSGLPPATPPTEAFPPTGSSTPLTLAWGIDGSGTTVEPPTLPAGSGSVIRGEPALLAGDTTPPDEVGRYKLTIPVTLDFSTAQQVRIVCWIRGTERVTGLTSSWAAPGSAGVHSPVPPVMPGPPGPLQWTSLADATGRARAHLTWAAVPGAVSYAVYHADETALLSAAGHLPPDLAAPLDDRKSALDAAVRIENVRDTFTRVTATPITDTSYDAELARGSQVLHGFVVLARSATGIESAWPTTPPAETGGRGYALYGIPRPRVPKPASVSAAAVSGTAVSIAVRAGADVGRVDLHRTALARLSGDVGAMGPAITTLTAAGDGSVASFTDTVAPSWQPYWYRAVAWGAPDDANGLRAAAGPASSAQTVLVPPTTPPGVTSAAVTPGSGATPALLSFRTDAPPVRTTAGPFLLQVVATTTDGGTGVGQAVLNTTLDALAYGQPSLPLPGSDVLGPAYLADDGSIGVFLRPAAGDTVISVRIRVTDPRGRAADATQVTP